MRWKRERERETFLSVTDENPFLFAGDNVPYTDSTVVATRNQGSTSCGQCSDSMVVTWEMETMVRIVLAVLLRWDEMGTAVEREKGRGKHTESPSSVPKHLNSGSVGLGNFQTLRE